MQGVEKIEPLRTPGITEPRKGFSLRGPGFKGEKYITPLITLGIALGIWHLVAASGIYTQEQLPGPWQVAKGAVELWDRGILFEHIGVSLYRFGVAYSLAVSSAIVLGLILGWYTRVLTAVDPFIQILRPISPIAWFPLAVLWFGIGNLPAIFIIFLSAFFPALLATISAVRNVDPVYIKVARNFKTSEKDILLKIVVPAAFPYITVGLHIALGTAWIHLVAGEMLGAQSGLGYLIVDSRNFLRTDWIILGMILIGLLGLVLNRLMRLAEKLVNKNWGFVPNTHE